jgi:hypothetical protein
MTPNETIETKVLQLVSITSNFLFVEYYSHERCDCWKIKDEFTEYRESKLVLCKVEEGFEKALDFAIEYLQVSKNKFLANQVLKTERDRKLFFDTIENPREPNEALKKAYESRDFFIDTDF